MDRREVADDRQAEAIARRRLVRANAALQHRRIAYPEQKPEAVAATNVIPLSGGQE